ncbi:hypothetical protein PR048_012340 [Dryococelus australis]|uniref:Uncharacterized protein n=1 Tax=Dryococelus australis TaxID=614101 RepID=A0ABQ9HPU9_9NEOP|nr:hypothetical protein PR048_012340 [Dryococelus australis]
MNLPITAVLVAQYNNVFIHITSPPNERSEVEWNEFELKIKRGERGGAPECKGGGNRRYPRKLAYRRHHLSDSQVKKIWDQPCEERNQVRLGGRRLHHRGRFTQRSGLMIPGFYRNFIYRSQDFSFRAGGSPALEYHTISPMANRVRSPLGGGFLSEISRFSCPFIPKLLHTNLASPSLALKTSMLRETQIHSVSTDHYRNARAEKREISEKIQERPPPGIEPCLSWRSSCCTSPTPPLVHGLIRMRGWLDVAFPVRNSRDNERANPVHLWSCGDAARHFPEQSARARRFVTRTHVTRGSTIPFTFLHPLRPVSFRTLSAGSLPWQRIRRSLAACFVSCAMAGGNERARENPPTNGIVIPIRDKPVRLGTGETEIPEKTRRPVALPGTIPTCENMVTRLGIEPSSPWWEASMLTTQTSWYLRACPMSKVSTWQCRQTAKGLSGQCNLIGEALERTGKLVSVATATSEKTALASRIFGGRRLSPALARHLRALPASGPDNKAAVDVNVGGESSEEIWVALNIEVLRADECEAR